MQVYEKRPWIAASASYDSQAQSLIDLIPRVWSQIQALAPKRPSRLSIVGIGASHAAAAAPAYRLRADGIDASRFLASELPAGTATGDGLTILVSQSGRSAEVVDLAKRVGGGAGLALTNYYPSPLTAVCGAELNLGNLSDSSVSFVSFTGTILALALLADYWAGRDQLAHWQSLVSRTAEAVLAADQDLDGVAARLVACPTVDFVAPASALSIAEEAALMFREGPRLMATGMETRQYLHGPMDAAKTAGHVVFGGAREAVLIDQLKEQTESLVYVTGQGAGAVKVPTWLTLDLPVSVDDGIGFSLAGSMVAQRLTLHASRHRSIDINEAVFVRLDTKTDRVGMPA